jgi:acyl-CoA reductase-like NAD-dependent aldehyde dehydrogenase
MAILFSGASMILAALAVEAGFPDGVLNVIHGTNVIFASLESHYHKIIYRGIN